MPWSIRTDPPWEADPGAARTRAAPPADLPGGLRMAWPPKGWPAQNCFEKWRKDGKNDGKNRGKLLNMMETWEKMVEYDEELRENGVFLAVGLWNWFEVVKKVLQFPSHLNKNHQNKLNRTSSRSLETQNLFIPMFSGPKRKKFHHRNS